MGPRDRVGNDERHDARARPILDAGQPDAANAMLSMGLDSACEPYLVVGAAAAAALQVVLAATIGKGGLVYIHCARKRRAVRVDHGPPKLVQQEPGGLVGYAQLGLKLQGRDRVRMRRHQVGGDEPFSERQVRALHDRPGDDRGLLATAGLVALPRAFEEPRPRLEAPSLLRAALRTDEPVRPSLLGQIFRTGVVVAESLHEFLDRRWPVVFPPGRK